MLNNSKGNAFLGRLLALAGIIGAILLAICAVYCLVTLNMKVFEVLFFGNGWLYLVFVLLGFLFSFINIPLYETKEHDVVHINLGGGILPLLLSAYFLYKIWPFLNLFVAAIVVLAVILLSRLLSVYRAGKGVQMLLVAHWFIILVSALAVCLTSSVPDMLPMKLAFGYIVSTIGVFIGADLLHLGMIGRDGRWGEKPSIGGAGVLDGVWLIGLNTMLLIYVFGW